MTVLMEFGFKLFVFRVVVYTRWLKSNARLKRKQVAFKFSDDALFYPVSVCSFLSLLSAFPFLNLMTLITLELID